MAKPVVIGLCGKALALLVYARLQAHRGGDDHICGYAEGSLSLVAHPTGLAAVACAATRLSAAGTKSAVRVLHAVARHSATPAVLQEMLVVGVGVRLLFLVQDLSRACLLEEKSM
ncbi:hypothetical protein OsI_32778 [Oryza sativa Indica Group]|uniref:U-box domain-containing protein n=1 Tax=Oryza sativa subsp. indica TaxID=39946 RepID=B8BFS2_ORYSI|nr:hypothetical protein OsI_32778 [Oryza sativa Indica Group]